MIPPVRIAHRGASGSGLAPENTLAAFEKAIELGVDAIEIDVHATADNYIVVLHDGTLDRTTDRQGAVRMMSLSQVRQADAGAWRGAAFVGERVPMLQEVLELARNRVVVLIEIKATHITERVLHIVSSMRADDQVVIQSFDAETVRRVRALDAGIPTAWLVGRVTPAPARLRARRMMRQGLRLGANALSVWHGALTPVVVDELRRRAMTLWAWTVDEDIVMRDLIAMGVQGIITNYPDRLNEVVENLPGSDPIHWLLNRRQRPLRTRWARRRRLRRLEAATASPARR